MTKIHLFAGGRQLENSVAIQKPLGANTFFLFWGFSLFLQICPFVPCTDCIQHALLNTAFNPKIRLSTLIWALVKLEVVDKNQGLGRQIVDYAITKIPNSPPDLASGQVGFHVFPS